jgi:hypothetical protein
MDDKKENQPRIGRAEAFKKMHEAGDDKLLIPDVFEDEEFFKNQEKEWSWSKKQDQTKKHT